MLIASQKEKKEALNMEKDAPIKTSHIKFPGIVYTLTQQGPSPPPLLETSTGALKYAVCMFFYMCVCRGRRSDPESSIPHYITKNEFMYNIQWRVQEFVRRGGGGGGENQKNNFFCLLPFQVGVGGSSKNSRENDISD